MKKSTIDPGHGGKDPGAIGPTGVHEEAINLAVAFKVSSILKSVAEVELTRYINTALADSLSADLAARAYQANAWPADVFVSIHCNSATDPSAHGTETHCYPGSSCGKSLAQMIQKRLVPALALTDRGVKESNFAVLRQSKMPAALVELSFISNPAEEKLLQSEEFQNKAAWSIASGICDFLGIQLQSVTQVPGPFPDVAGDRWSAGHIAKVKELGLMVGGGDGCFNPEAPLTREQMAAIICKMIDKGMI